MLGEASTDGINDSTGAVDYTKYCLLSILGWKLNHGRKNDLNGEK